MGREVLRSVLAVATGWVAMFVGVFTTMAAIAIANPEDFRSDVPPAFGWQLVVLSLCCICLIVGGFTAGAVARRHEIGHAVGLALFTFLISLYFTTADGDVAHPPMWYTIVGYAVLLPSTLLGGWLRMRQRILIENGSERLIRTVSEVRYFVGIGVSLVTFFVATLLGLVLGATVLAVISRTLVRVDLLILPVFAASIILSFRLSRFIFRRIAGVSDSLIDQIRGS